MKPYWKLNNSAEPMIDKRLESIEKSKSVRMLCLGLVLGFVLGIITIFKLVYNGNF